MQDNVIAHMAYQSMLALREVFGDQIFNHWPPHIPHLYEILYMWVVLKYKACVSILRAAEN
jgi:hypothetical protein